MTDPTSIARLAHEMNRRWCQLTGDDSQPPWENAPDWQRDSAIAGVKAILGGHITSPAGSHDSWCMRKFHEGWTRGETKDPKAKTHPCLVPFDELPPHQQVKDSIFFAVVGAYILDMAHLGAER